MRNLGTALLRWGPVLAWMGIIYFFSSRPDLPHIDEPWLELSLRKLAHAVEYAILGALLARAIGVNGWRGVISAAALGMAYAASDEWHQTFVPGRKGNLIDVSLDSVAALAGAYLWLRFSTKTKGNPTTEAQREPDTKTHSVAP